MFGKIQSQRVVLITLALTGLVVVCCGACQQKGGKTSPPIPTAGYPIKTVAPMDRLRGLESTGLPLASMRNQMISGNSLSFFPHQRLFVIDGELLFWERSGNVSDARFDHVLMDRSKKMICDYADNIAGARIGCADNSKTELFKIIVGNLDKNDLGLTGHTVELIYASAPSLR